MNNSDNTTRIKLHKRRVNKLTWAFIPLMVGLALLFDQTLQAALFGLFTGLVFMTAIGMDAMVHRVGFTQTGEMYQYFFSSKSKMPFDTRTTCSYRNSYPRIGGSFLLLSSGNSLLAVIPAKHWENQTGFIQDFTNWLHFNHIAVDQKASIQLSDVDPLK